MAKEDYLLNHIFLKNRIAELGVKQWWLAEQIGVDRKTVVRWVQGQVKSIQSGNAEKLAKILDCKLEDLTANNLAEQLATIEDQKAAAALLTTSSLIDKLGPVGEWNVIESLLKAVIVPNLPLNILGGLYSQLTIASWRQSKIDQAAVYNSKAEEIAIKTGDKELLAAVLLSKANICSWRGEIRQSVATYRLCVNLKSYIEARALGSVYSNLGAVLYESGNLAEGELYIRMSISIFDEVGKSTNLSIARCHLARVLLKKLDLNSAYYEALASIQFAKQDDYYRGLAMGKLILAEVSAIRGEEAEAKKLVSEALASFENLGIKEGLNFEFAGRVYRILGLVDQADKFIRQGIRLSQSFPLELAALHVELAEILRMTGADNWAREADKAVEIFYKSECPLLAEEVKRQFKLK